MNAFIKKVEQEKIEKQNLQAKNEEENAKLEEEKKNEELKKEREQKNKLNILKKQKDCQWNETLSEQQEVNRKEKGYNTLAISILILKQMGLPNSTTE